MTYTKDLSIVISLFNEEESLPELISWIEKVMAAEGYSYEVIMVDDGSRDESWKLIKEFSQKNPSIRGISFRRNYGKPTAISIKHGRLPMLHIVSATPTDCSAPINSAEKH